jgi:CRISPR/Cas system-associated exonuclease Cas4 (RecB family)
MARFLEELSDLEKLSLIDFSYSRLDTYNQCAAKYFYTYILKQDRLFGAAATLGNILHSALENTLEAGEPVSLSPLLQEFKKQVPAWDPDSQIPNNLIMDGVTMLTEFVDRHENESFPIEAKEKEFAIVVGSALIRGYIDRIDIEDNLIRITDYKSGKYEVANKDIPSNLQLGIYALATSKIYPGKPIYAQLYYLRSGKIKGHLFTDDDLNRVEDSLIAITSEIIETENFNTTANARMCYFCDYAKDLCPTGKSRLRRT